MRVPEEASRFDNPRPSRYTARLLSGAVAQLGERLNGIQEVEGSTPFGSTKASDIPPQSMRPPGSRRPSCFSEKGLSLKRLLALATLPCGSSGVGSVRRQSEALARRVPRSADKPGGERLAAKESARRRRLEADAQDVRGDAPPVPAGLCPGRPAGARPPAGAPGHRPRAAGHQHAQHERAGVPGRAPRRRHAKPTCR